MTPKQHFAYSILLLGHDRRLVETRQWVLEKAGFQVHAALSVTELETIAAEGKVDLFLLCNSLHADVRLRALSLIHAQWPESKRLVMTPYTFSTAFNPEEQVLQAIEGPGKLVATVHTLAASLSFSRSNVAMTPNL